MAFVWRTGTTGRDSILLLSPGAELGIRIAISAILALGVIYFTLILNTLRRYGDAMDKSFKARVDAWAKERYQDYQSRPHHVWPPAENYPPSFIGNSYGNPGHYPHSVSRSSVGTTTSNQDSTLYPSPSSTVFESVKIMDLRFQNRGGSAMPDFLMKRGFKHEDWERFISVCTRLSANYSMADVKSGGITCMGWGRSTPSQETTWKILGGATEASRLCCRVTRKME